MLVAEEAMASISTNV